jgi:hypothetical protein
MRWGLFVWFLCRGSSERQGLETFKDQFSVSRFSVFRLRSFLRQKMKLCGSQGLREREVDETVVLGAASCRAGRRGVVGFELRGWRGWWLEVDGAVGGDHLCDRVFEGFDAFSGDRGDFVEG